jgi:hypothetical protein
VSPLFPLAGERSSEFVARFSPRATNVRGRRQPPKFGSRDS